MYKKNHLLIGFTLFLSFILVLSIALAQIPGDNRNPVYTGKCVNAGTITSIDTENKLLLVNSLDYGVIPLKVNDSTEIKIDNNYLNFEDIRMGDNIGFEGFWSGNLVSVTDVIVLQGPPETYYAVIYPEGNNTENNNTAYTYSSQNIETGSTYSQALSNLEIIKIVIRKGPSKVNLRVRLYNNGSLDIEEPFAIVLYIRQSPSDEYELLKVWEENYTKSYNYLSRDFFLVAPSPYLLTTSFQVKAELVDSGGNVFYKFEQIYNGADII